jgi:hypothetical protein
VDKFGVIQLTEASGPNLERFGWFGNWGRIWRDFEGGHAAS